MTTSRQRFYLATLVAVCIAFGAATRSAKAAFHLWYIKEAFTNQSGSVQFVELFTDFSSQEFVNGITLTSNANTFTFPSNTASPTDGHHVLLATAGFGSLPGGATPDFTIPSNFFNPAGDTISFAPDFGVDEKTFTSAPTDGVNSLNFTGQFSAATTAVNSPRNYAGAGGSVDLSAPSPTGDYNGNHTVDAGDYVVWRKTLNGSASPAGSGADGDSSGTIGPGDYTFWRARFGNAAPGSGSLAAGLVPEPATVSLQLGCLFAFTWRVRKRTKARGKHQC